MADIIDKPFQQGLFIIHSTPLLGESEVITYTITMDGLYSIFVANKSVSLFSRNYFGFRRRNDVKKIIKI